MRIVTASRRRPGPSHRSRSGGPGRRPFGLMAGAGVALAAMLTVETLTRAPPLAGAPPLAPAGALGQLPAGLPGAWRTLANGDDVLALAIEGDVLWAGTRGGGLVRWDTEARTYVQYLRPQDPLAANTVRDIAVDSAGRKWLATAAGLTVFDDAGTPARDDDQWRTFTVANTFGGLPSDDVWALALQGTSIWVGTHQVQDMATKAWSGGGLGRLDGAATWDTADDVWMPIATYSSTRHTRPDATEVLGLVSDNIDDLALTPQGRLWVATVRHRLLDTDAGSWPAVHGGISALDTQGTADPGDDVWAGASCEDQPLVVSCHVTSLALDSDGWVWAGTRGRGAMFFRADGFTFGSNGDQRLGSGDGLPATDVLAVAVGPPASQKIYLATTAGLAVFDHGGTVRDRRDDTMTVLGGADLGRDRVQGVAAAGPVLWAAMGPLYGDGGGVVRVDTPGLTVEDVLWTSAARGGASPSSNFVRDIDFGDPGSPWAGHVWIASGSGEQRLFGAGAMDLDTAGTSDPGDDAWTAYNTAGTDDDGRPPWTGLPGDNLQAVEVVGDAVWFGAAEATWNAAARSYDDGGLAVFDGTRWTRRPTTEGGLRSDSVSSLAEGCDGRLWVGTGTRWVDGQGVDILDVAGSIHDPAADVWQAVSFPSLATNNTTAVSVNCDPETVWVSGTHQDRAGRWSDGGVARYDAAAGTWTAFDTTNGLTSFAHKGIKAEAKSVLALPGGRAVAGTYGNADTTQRRLIEDRPYWPAVLNTWDGSAWSARVFEGAGWVSSQAQDASGSLWVALSRGGTARDSIDPENWRVDGDVPGLMLKVAGTWQGLGTAAGLPANDVSVVAVAPDGAVWVGTEGWGLGEYRPEAAAPTATATSAAQPPTATATATATATGEATATGSASTTPSPTAPTPGGATATPTHAGTQGAPVASVYLPVCRQGLR